MNLLDANDHAPVLSPLTSPIIIPEDTPISSIIAVATATDEDEGTNAELQFLIRTGNTGGGFGMRADGSLIVQASLDHEMVSLYTLVIEAWDRGIPQLTDSITVVINVTDVNDNAPEFINLETVVEVEEVRKWS